MKRILFRSVGILFVAVVFFLFMIVFGWAIVDEVVYKGDLYCLVGRSYTFVADATSKIIFSGDHNLTIEEAEDNDYWNSTHYRDGKLYYGNGELEDRVICNNQIYLDGAYSDFDMLLSKETKAYRITSDVACTFTITVMKRKVYPGRVTFTT